MGFITNSKTTVLKKTRIKLYAAIVVGLFCLITAVTLSLIDPVLLIAKYSTRVAYGTYIHEALMEKIDGIHISAYLFNITNYERFQSGEDFKLKVQEIGPFTYQEFRSNDKLEIDQEAGVIRYSPKQDVIFVPKESIGNPEDVNVTMPNIAMLSMASKMSAFSYIPRMGFNLLTYKLNSKAIVKMSAKDYLWGYDEPLIKLGNNVMPGFVTFPTLGILDRLYDKNAKYMLEVSAREHDKFSIKTVNGSGGLTMWGYGERNKSDYCNSFTNVYEGIAYPPEMTPEKPIRLYRSILCRFLELNFFKKVTMPYGAEGLVYKISNRTFSYNGNDTKCLCNRGICEDGISDMSPCFLGLPIVLSNAHFLHMDPKLYERVDGMKPDEDFHGSAFTIEPKIGMVLTTLFSVQVNVLVKDVSFNQETKQFSDMLVPVAYVRIVQPKLRPKDIYNLRMIYVYGPCIVIFVQTILVISGLMLLAYCVRLLYWNWTYSEKKSMAFHVSASEKPSVESPLMT